MEAGRTVKMRARMRWGALGFVLIWVAAISAAAAGGSSSCESRTGKSDCAAMESGCCCDDSASLPSDPGNALPIVVPQESLAVLPGFELVAVGLGDLGSGETLRRERFGDFLIPAELRLGSALWSHAPPTRFA